MAVCILLLVPTSLVAAERLPQEDTTPAVDTPAPRNGPERTQRPARTPLPESTATARPQSSGSAVPAPVPPDRDTLVVGYYESGVMGQLPLLVAQLAGYFEDAGFAGVTLVEVPSVRRDLQNGDLDFGVVPMPDAYEAFGDDAMTSAVAGYKSYAGKRGRFGGDLLVATPGLVAHEPATVIAFLSAYIRGLQDLAEPDSAAAALALIEASALAVEPAVAEQWDDEVAVFAPFDGGFGIDRSTMASANWPMSLASSMGTRGTSKASWPRTR